MGEREYWLAFSKIKGLGPVRFQKLLNYFQNLSVAWNASYFDLLSSGITKKNVDEIVLRREEIDVPNLSEALEEKNISYLTWEDLSYPKWLRETPQAPPVLYYRGTLLPADELAVAIVGTRNVTSYGKQITVDTAKYLAGNGITIVSGLARGVDGLAHQAALDAGGRTIAVFGTGVDLIYPSEHRKLAEDIMKSGAIISDYPPGTKPDAVNFPPRNRIISGLSRLTLVIEAGERSGALITARFAADQNRDVFAVPGSVLSPMSRGTNALIAQGAIPMTSPKQILEHLKLSPQAVSNASLPQPDLNEMVILHALADKDLHIDDIAAQLSFNIEKLNVLLTMMEIKGFVSRGINGVYHANQDWKY